MRTDVKLSTKFLTTQNAHQVGVLVTLSGEVPVQRAPINVALVLDRSGSMGGRPLEAAKDAAKRFAEQQQRFRDGLTITAGCEPK